MKALSNKYFHKNVINPPACAPFLVFTIHFLCGIHKFWIWIKDGLSVWNGELVKLV